MSFSEPFALEYSISNALFVSSSKALMLGWSDNTLQQDFFNDLIDASRAAWLAWKSKEQLAGNTELDTNINALNLWLQCINDLVQDEVIKRRIRSWIYDSWVLPPIPFHTRMELGPLTRYYEANHHTALTDMELSLLGELRTLRKLTRECEERETREWQDVVRSVEWDAWDEQVARHYYWSRDEYIFLITEGGNRIAVDSYFLSHFRKLSHMYGPQSIIRLYDFPGCEVTAEQILQVLNPVMDSVVDPKNWTPK